MTIRCSSNSHRDSTGRWRRTDDIKSRILSAILFRQREDSTFEELASRQPLEAAPPSLKSRVYSSLVLRQAEAPRYSLFPKSRQPERSLCVSKNSSRSRLSAKGSSQRILPRVPCAHSRRASGFGSDLVDRLSLRALSGALSWRGEFTLSGQLRGRLMWEHDSTRVRQHVNTPREKVYSALVDADAIARWKVPDGMTSHVHKFEAARAARSGSRWTYDAPGALGKTTAHTDTYHGRFVKLLPNEMVVEVVEFETADPAMSGEMTITTTLADADGGTEVVAVHDGTTARPVARRQ